MAHLRPGDPDPRPANGAGGGRDRAQLLLLAGFVLAAVFVAFAFLLNSVIYTENLATRGEGARTTDAVVVADDAATGTAAVVRYANEHETDTYATLEAELTSGVADIERLAGTQQLANGGVLRVEYVSYRKGTWVNQTYHERNFTDDDFDPDWTLFTGADGVRAFRIHVTDPTKLERVSILDTQPSADNFTVVARDGAGTWRMRVYHDNTDIVNAVPGTGYVVEVTDGDGDTRYCSISDSVTSFWINVSAGTLAGEECRALRFGEDLGAIDQVDFSNGDQIYGTYRLMAAKDEGTVSSTVYNSTGSPPPHPLPPVTDPAIYNATIHVTYETERLHFETDRKVKLKREADDD